MHTRHDSTFSKVQGAQEIAEAICFYCQSEDIDCKCINRGRKALDSIRSEKFDLILLDLAMPWYYIWQEQ